MYTIHMDTNERKMKFVNSDFETTSEYTIIVLKQYWENCIDVISVENQLGLLSAYIGIAKKYHAVQNEIYSDTRSGIQFLHFKNYGIFLIDSEYNVIDFPFDAQTISQSFNVATEMNDRFLKNFAYAC